MGSRAFVSLTAGTATSKSGSSVISSICFISSTHDDSSLSADSRLYSSVARWAVSWARSAFDILPTSIIARPRSSFFLLASKLCLFTVIASLMYNIWTYKPAIAS